MITESFGCVIAGHDQLEKSGVARYPAVPMLRGDQPRKEDGSVSGESGEQTSAAAI